MQNKLKALLFSLFLVGWTFCPTHFFIVIASYNNQDYTRWCLESALRQEYSGPVDIVFVDDCSTDKTFEVAQQVVVEQGAEDRVRLIKNSTRKRQLQNQYDAIHTYAPDDAVVVILDGDDALWGTDVLQKLDGVYSSSDVWITYGQYKRLKLGQMGICCEFPKWVIEQQAFRQYDWVSAHLRTFKAWLFKRIKKEDLMYQGQMVPSSADKAAMYPMLEMASGTGGIHIKFIPDILLIHNDRNNLNCYKVYDVTQRQTLENYIRGMTPYAAIY